MIATTTTFTLWVLFTAIAIAIIVPLANRVDGWLHNRRQAQIINDWLADELKRDRT